MRPLVHEAGTPERLVIDMARVDFPDSSGIGVLVDARNRCVDLNIDLVGKSLLDSGRDHGPASTVGQVRSVSSEWSPPSDAVAVLLRRAAIAALAEHEIIDVMNERSVSTLPRVILADPVLGETVRNVNRANVVHWLRHTADHPGERVPPARSRQALALGRDLVRRGHDASALATYLYGQNVAWQFWMRRCFTVTDDMNALEDLLDYSARSMFSFVQVTIAELGKVMRSERSTLTEGAYAERFDLVQLVLEHSPITADVAGARLGHDVRVEQTAAVFWHDPLTSQAADLEQAALAAGIVAKVARPLLVTATSTSLWAWYASVDVPDIEAITGSVTAFHGVRVAVGGTAPGLDGFRRSHTEAVSAQRMMFRAPTLVRSATFDEVDVVSLVTADAEHAQQFVTRTLGNLATAEPALRETLRVYLRADANATRAARTLFTHRNTVLNRLSRAEALLPRTLEGHGLAIGLALEIQRWLGPSTSTGQGDDRRSRNAE